MKDSNKVFPAWRKLTGYNEIYTDPYVEIIGQDDDFIVIKGTMGLYDRIHCFEKGISVMIEPVGKSDDSTPLITLGGTDASILSLDTRHGKKTLSYPISQEEISDKMKKEIVKEDI